MVSGTYFMAAQAGFVSVATIYHNCQLAAGFEENLICHLERAHSK
jgi:hypothetical protein